MLWKLNKICKIGDTRVLLFFQNPNQSISPTLQSQTYKAENIPH